MKKLNKNFKSNIDKFLEDFDRQYPKQSSSQQEEIKKYSRINQLRDLPISQENADKIWETF